MRPRALVARRTFLRGGIVTTGALALPFLYSRSPRSPRSPRRALAQGLGPLVPDPLDRLDLPEGFSYEILDRHGDIMSDGYRVPGNPDGMACFSGPNGTLVLLRNHELSLSSRGPYTAQQTAPPQAYDSRLAGGVTRLVIDASTMQRVSSNLVLAGTALNCSGGPSPWGWLSCEETFDLQHGYVFVCRADVATVQAPVRVPGYGHFRHEAVAIDPATNTAYLTEDRSDGVLYRFIPTNAAVPFTGKLQALAVPGKPPNYTTATGLSVGDVLDVSWVDIENPDPAGDTLRHDARDDGAAIFSRGEGIWFNHGVVYFTCTDGGPAQSGQVFALRPTPTGGTLTLVAQSENPSSLDGPDNLTMSPWGDLLIAEDSVNSNSDNYIRCLTPSGTMWDFARTRLSELSGLCFSPDGRALFVNIFGADMTLVIRGPFPVGDPGGGGHGGEGGGSGGSSGGQAGEPSGGEANGGAGGAGPGEGGAGASDDGGAGSGDGSGGAPSGGSSSGGASSGGSLMGGARTGGASGSAGASVGSSRHPSSDSKDDPGCGCEIPGRRRG